MGVGCEVSKFCKKTASFSLSPPPIHNHNHDRSPPWRNTPPPQLSPRPHTHPLSQRHDWTRRALHGHRRLLSNPPSTSRPSPGRIEAATDRRGLILINQALSRPTSTTNRPRSTNNSCYYIGDEAKVSNIYCDMIFFTSHYHARSHLLPFPEHPHCLLQPNQLPDPSNVSPNGLLSRYG
jgi:hypothetical protein